MSTGPSTNAFFGVVRNMSAMNVFLANLLDYAIRFLYGLLCVDVKPVVNRALMHTLGSFITLKMHPLFH